MAYVFLQPAWAMQHAMFSMWVVSSVVVNNVVSVQLTSPVQWERSLKTLLERGLQSSYEIGPNKVIAGIMKRVDKAHSITNVTV